MFKKTLDRIGQLLALKKNKTHYADCVIRDEKGRICLLHRSYQDDFAPGKWCLPGGHIEDGEEPIFAAGRELEEETGYKAVPLFYLDKVDRKDSVSLYYEGFVYSQTAVLLDNDEHYRIQWVEPKDLDDYELLLDLKDTLAKLPLSPVPTLPEVAPIGEDLYTSWQNNLTSFDEGKIDESVFFKTIEIHKAVAAYELVTRAFDNDAITPEEFSRVCNIEKGEGFDQALELAKGTDTEVLEEIVKGGSHKYIRKEFKNGEWNYIYSEEKSDSNEKAISGKDIVAQNKGLSSSEDGSAFIKESDSFIQQTLPLEEINNKLTYAWYKRNDMDEDLSMIDKIIDKIKSGTKLHPIVLDENNKILDGNHRLIAYKKLKYTEIPVYKRQNDKVEKMDTGSTPGFETVTENGKLVKSEDKETKTDHTKWL